MQKEIAIKTINNLPEDATMEQIIYELYVRMKVQEGLNGIENGEVVTHEEVKEELKKWR